MGEAQALRPPTAIAGTVGNLRRFTIPIASIALSDASRRALEKTLSRGRGINEKVRAISFFKRLKHEELKKICSFNGIPYESRTRKWLLQLLQGAIEIHSPATANSSIPDIRDGAKAPIVIIRGRVFVAEDIAIIQSVADRFGGHGVTAVSNIVCDHLNWRQPNGWPKSRACRVALARLVRLGHIKNLSNLTSNRARPYSHSISSKLQDKPEPRIGKYAIAGTLRMSPIGTRVEEKEWNKLVSQYHYLGHLVTVGRCLKLIVRDDEEIVAAMSLSDASWKIQGRDAILSHLTIRKYEVANNSRFLVLPHVHVKHLASQCLSLLATVGAKIWSDYYACRLRVIETYVDPSLYQGTCYKAANWIYIGDTKGFKKSGSGHQKTNCPKLHFIYPMTGKLRQAIEGLRGNPVKLIVGGA